MSKARTLANLISDNAELADGQISVSEVVGAAPLASPTFTGNVDLGDDVRIRLGNSDDLQLYHDSTSENTFIDEVGAGSLFIRDNNNIALKRQSDNANMVVARAGAEVELYHNGSEKLATATDGVTITGKTTTDELDLNALAATISDTAVDVFVYDTRKDSDGGAWRKRTQHTSWYNEAASSTRGSRKEFPAVAVIVTESNKVTIYDGDDPDMPMWMVFDGGDRADMIYGLSDNSQQSTKMLNGLLVSVGNDSGGQGGTFPISFIADNGYFLSDAITSPYKYKGNIEQRNDGLNISVGDSGNYGLTVSRYVNDVAMTVLPNAPIDAATGLPVPTIAVATNGGVSVIKDDGTVVDLTHTVSTNNQSNHVNFTDTGGICYQSRSGSVYFLEYDKLPSADTAATPDTILNPGQTAHSTGLSLSPSGDMESIVVKGSKRFFGRSENYGEPNGGLQIIDIHEKSSTANGYNLSVCDILSSYNTGWMNGDIKLATLSDTDDTDVTGSELVTNGDGSTTTGWTAQNATLSSVGGSLRVADNGAYSKAYQALTTVVGKTYVFAVNITAISGSNAVIAIGNNTPSTGAWNDYYASHSTTGVKTITYTAESTTTYIELGSESTHSVDYDNISVRLAEEDRSVNGNGLQVFGTVTKNPVATGADLVAYSGFSGSNYLEQPYNSDLDFGTGDYCAMGWIKLSSAPAGNIRIFRRAYHTGSAYSGSSISLEVLGGTGYLYTNVTDDSYASFDFVQSTSSVAGIGWVHVAVVRSDNTLSLYVNGKYNNSITTTAALGSLDNPNAVLTVSNDPTHSSSTAFTGSLALFRISATAPSPEQIAKIYEDEKHLFQDGAQATLYGSSDAVTALAYDDSTELLHVGTSAGRSVFQGLRRVDNTTDAVGAAISASNGLVAED